jgi:four helix bundle protein
MLKSYKDLIAWQKARILVKEIYELTGKFPEAEKYALSSQLRRAAISIPSNIAEGRMRGTRKDFRNFVSIAIASLAEVDTQLILENDLNYISEIDYNEIFVRVEELQKILHGLRNSLNPKG